MAWFRCIVRGENFPGALIGRKGRIGFYATRFVEANDPEKAEMKVLSTLRNEQELRIPRIRRSKHATVYFEEIVEVAVPSMRRRRTTGFTFYAQGTLQAETMTDNSVIERCAERNPT